MGQGREWTQVEVRHAIALYLFLDRRWLHAPNPDAVVLAERQGRTPGAVALKLTNLAALGESLACKRTADVSVVDRHTWSPRNNARARASSSRLPLTGVVQARTVAKECGCRWKGRLRGAMSAIPVEHRR